MSSPQVQMIFNGLPDQLRRLGGYSSITNLSSIILWQGRVDSTQGAAADAGHDAAVLDIDTGAWATGHRQLLVIADPAAPGSGSDNAGFHTQSNALGYTLDGSVRFRLYLETPFTWTAAQAFFDRLVMQMFLGQLGAPLTLNYCNNATQPTVAGVNGVLSGAGNSTFVSAGFYMPYGGISYPGGV